MSRAFEPIRVGRWDLPQRFVMAPLTRNRAGAGQVPTELAATYYGQRAGAGLIVSEGSQPSAVGQGYLATPGVHTAEQVEGWRGVADAVHAGGGRIVVQLMHAGRIAHPDNKGGLESVAPSAIAAPGEMVTADGTRPHPTPRALGSDEVEGVVEEFVDAARNAVEAGLDGVEVHAANGYLLHQFLAPSTNHRDDAWGGSPSAARGSPSRSPEPSPRRSAPTGSGSASPRRTTSRASSRRTRPRPRRPTPRSSTRWPRSGWPTCPSSATPAGTSSATSVAGSAARSCSTPGSSE